MWAEAVQVIANVDRLLLCCYYGTYTIARSMKILRTAPVLAAALSAPLLAVAQIPSFEMTYGLWWTDDSTTATFSAAYSRPLFGPLSYSIGFTHVQDNRSLADHTFSGGEFGVAFGRDGAGPYALATIGVGVQHLTGALDAAWSAGAGYGFRPLTFLSVGLEARYRAEDRDFAGFWRLHPDDRRGLVIAGRLALSLPGAGRPPTTALVPGAGTSGTPGVPAPTPAAPDAERRRDLARASGATAEDARAITSVVETALAVMGTPYQWGGSNENGFDCSGLIHYAYGQHGIVLPRVSRDQMRMGRVIDKSVDALRPGDLIGFSVERTSRITHIGLYVGDGRFIHSASNGVKLTSLLGTDGESRWWRDRWVSARRIID